MMNSFRSCHPFTQLICFSSVVGLTMFYIHPVFLIISLTAVCIYAGASGMLRFLRITLPAGLLIVIINMLVSHNGITVLYDLPDGNVLTAEALIFGIAAAVLMGVSVGWFYLYSGIFTTERVIYLFGKVSPRLALLISMTIRFFRKLSYQYKAVRAASLVMYGEQKKHSPVRSAGRGMRELSALIQWALETSVETADSMNSRGYGLKKRTFYAAYEFRKTDIILIISAVILDLYIIAGCISGWMEYSYYPYFEISDADTASLSVYGAFVLICCLPGMAELWEVNRWK